MVDRHRRRLRDRNGGARRSKQCGSAHVLPREGQRFNVNDTSQYWELLTQPRVNNTWPVDARANNSIRLSRGTYRRSLSAAVASILASRRSIFPASPFHFPSCPALYRAGKTIKSVSSWFPFNHAWNRKILDRCISLATGRLCGQLPSFLQWDLLDACICKGTLPDPRQLWTCQRGRRRLRSQRALPLVVLCWLQTGQHGTGC